MGVAYTGMLRPTTGTAASTVATVIFVMMLRTPEDLCELIDNS
jgi:hypothetical protein